LHIKLYTLWNRLFGSFWFIPTVMVGMATILAFVLTGLDRTDLLTRFPDLPLIYIGNPDGTRSLLSMIGGSMISVTGVTFSITIVALSLASSQLGPRLLNNFMRDRGNQIVLGTFVSVFTYCLLVLRTVRGSEDTTFVPQISVTVAILLAMISLAVLIYFFHHVSTSIQAQNVIANIGEELQATLDRLFSEGKNTFPYEHKLRNEDDIPDDFDDKSEYLSAKGSGYLQAVDYDKLEKIATKNDLLIRLLYRPGNFIAKNSELVAVYGGSLTDELADDIDDTFSLGVQRIRVQDIEYAIDQLVEIAVRALSPGINDPFTAIACLDQLSVVLSDMAGRIIPSGYYYDDDGNLRLIRDVVTFNHLVGSAFDQIRRYARSDVDVTIRLLEVLAIIIANTAKDEHKKPLIEQAKMVKRASDECILDKHDREVIEKRYQLVERVLENNDKPVPDSDPET